MNPFYPEVALSVSNQNHVGVLLLNLGTPDAPTPEALRSYLREFLSDPRVVEMPQWLWQPMLQQNLAKRRFTVRNFYSPTAQRFARAVA